MYTLGTSPTVAKQLTAVNLMPKGLKDMLVLIELVTVSYLFFFYYAIVGQLSLPVSADSLTYLSFSTCIPLPQINVQITKIGC